MGPCLLSVCRAWRPHVWWAAAAGAVVYSSGVLSSPGLGTGTARWEPRPAPEAAGRESASPRRPGTAEGLAEGLTQGTLRVQPRAVVLDPTDSVPEQGTQGEPHVFEEPGTPRESRVQGA